jgi:hypothetical protein
MTTTIPDVEGITTVIEERVEDLESNKVRHIVSPPENTHIWKTWMTDAQDVVDYARNNGIAVVALCGTSFIPRHDPIDMDTCEPCIEAAAKIQSGEL